MPATIGVSRSTQRETLLKESHAAIRGNWPAVKRAGRDLLGSKTVSRCRKPAISLYFGTIRYSGLCADTMCAGGAAVTATRDHGWCPQLPLAARARWLRRRPTARAGARCRARARARARRPRCSSSAFPGHGARPAARGRRARPAAAGLPLVAQPTRPAGARPPR